MDLLQSELLHVSSEMPDRIKKRNNGRSADACLSCAGQHSAWHFDDSHLRIACACQPRVESGPSKPHQICRRISEARDGETSPDTGYADAQKKGFAHRF